LEDDVGDAAPNVSLVKMVPEVAEVLAGPLFVQLQHVVDHRVYEAHQHHGAELESVGILAVQVHLVDVEGMDKHIDRVYESSKEMDVLGVGVPVKFDEIPHHFAVEKLDFFRFRNDFHQDVCARRSINVPILLVI